MPGTDDVVGEETEEGTVTHHLGGFEDGVTEAEWLFLDHRSDPDVLETGQWPAQLEVLGDEMAGVEIDYDDGLFGPGPRRLLDRVLDGRPVDHGDECLGHDPRRRSHPGSPPAAGMTATSTLMSRLSARCPHDTLDVAPCDARRLRHGRQQPDQAHAADPLPRSPAGSMAEHTINEEIEAVLVSLTRTSQLVTTISPTMGMVKKRTPRPVATPLPPSKPVEHRVAMADRPRRNRRGTPTGRGGRPVGRRRSSPWLPRRRL